MHLMARGIDRSEVEERVGVKSVSHETTFEEDTADSVVILKALMAYVSMFKRKLKTNISSSKPSR